MAAAPTTPTEYITGHLTHFAKPVGGGRRLLDDPRRHAGDDADRRRSGLRLPVVGGSRRDFRRAGQAPGRRRIARRFRPRTGEIDLPRGFEPRRAARVDDVHAGAVPERDGLPAGRHRGEVHAPVRAPLADRADRRRQHDVRARAVDPVADARLRDPRQGRSAASSTSCSPRRSASIRCSGRRTS